MEEKKISRFGGSKVSEIANIFQAKVPGQKEDIITPIRTKPKIAHCTPEKIEDSPSVTVMRTESHVTRFNNARAMFEKLGEENKSSRGRAVPLQSTKSASSILDGRSRSSSANSETRDTKSCYGSRSPSPLENKSLISNDGANPNEINKPDSVLNEVNKPSSVLNEHNKPSLVLHEVHVPSLVLNEVNKPNGFKDAERKSEIIGGNEVKSEEMCKPALMKKPEKPEKPERKFNSKELIERQRNWTSHFSKTRNTR